MKVCTKVPKRKVSRWSVLLFRKGFWLLCFATWSGHCHRDPSNILCYWFVGRVNNMEKLLMSSKELKWGVLHSTNCFAFFFFFKYVFKKACFSLRTRMHNNLGELKLLFFHLPLSQAAWQFWWGAKSERKLWEQMLWCFMILIRYCIKEKNIMNTSTYTFYFPSNINS